MNWKQLYTAANAQERYEILCSLLQAIEARRKKIVFIFPLSIHALWMGRGQGWGFIRERRIALRAHFIHDRRGHIPPWLALPA